MDFEITFSPFPVNTKYSSKCSRLKAFPEIYPTNSFGHGISLKHYQLISSPYIEILCYLQSTALYIKPACYLQTTLTPLHIKAAYFFQFTALYNVQLSVYLWSTSNPHRFIRSQHVTCNLYYQWNPYKDDTTQVFKQSMWSNNEQEIAHEVINWFSYVPFRGHATFSLWCKVFPFATCDVCIKIIAISDLAGAVEPLFFLFELTPSFVNKL